MSKLTDSDLLKSLELEQTLILIITNLNLTLVVKLDTLRLLRPSQLRPETETRDSEICFIRMCVRSVHDA